MHKILKDGQYIKIDNITKNELDLDKTLDCGQAFRWRKDSDGCWVGMIKNNLCILKQHENYIETNITEDKKDEFINYFNIDMCYEDEIGKLDLDTYARKTYEFSKGIHILRQPYFEATVTFLMSSCNTMRNIRNIVNSLSEKFGEQVETEYKGKKYVDYAFPTLENLNKASLFDLQLCKMGFRADYLKSLCERLSENNILEQLEKYVNGDTGKYRMTIKTLRMFKGIGDKVANCIALFAGHHLCAFPIDTHMQQIIDTEYGGKIDLSKYKEYSGIIQQYMFYYKAFTK